MNKPKLILPKKELLKPGTIASVVYSPQEDVTLFELAQLTGILIMLYSPRNGQYPNAYQMIANSPYSIQRHFTINGLRPEPPATEDETGDSDGKDD